MSSTNLKNFKGFKGKIHYEPIIEEYAERCCSALRVTSPRRRRGRYAQGWTVNYDRRVGGVFGGIVWNRTDWQLTHLLENGHLIVNKRGGSGWASPVPHIENAYQKVKDPFIDAMRKADIEIK